MGVVGARNLGLLVAVHKTSRCSSLFFRIDYFGINVNNFMNSKLCILLTFGFLLSLDLPSYTQFVKIGPSHA
jgi:hypothetical protein